MLPFFKIMGAYSLPADLVAPLLLENGVTLLGLMFPKIHAVAGAYKSYLKKTL